MTNSLCNLTEEPQKPANSSGTKKKQKEQTPHHAAKTIEYSDVQQYG